MNCDNHLVLKSELGTDAVGASANGGILELVGVDGNTKRGLDTRAEGLGVGESKSTSAGNLGLDKCSLVKIDLGANFEVHGVGGRGRVVDGLCARLDVSVDTVIVRSREETHVAETVDGDSIVWRCVTEGGRIAGDRSVVDIVVCLCTDEDTVASKDNVARDIRPVEEVKGGTGVITGLLESQVEETAIDALFRIQARVGLEFETLCELVLNLELGAEDVGSRPCVGEDGSILVVGVFCLEVACNGARLCIACAGDAESDVGGRLGLDFESNRMERIVLAQEIVGTLSEILPGRWDGDGERHS